MKTISWIKIAICVSILVGTLLLTSCSLVENFNFFGKNKATNYKGIGSSVNLLTGSYTDFASGTTSIFDKNKFKEFEVSVDTKKTQETVVTYSESLQEYIDQISEAHTDKMKFDASVGYAGIAKISAGYSFEVSNEYVAKTINETKTIFYDMDYYYIDKVVEIDGYNDQDMLSKALSDKFLADAKKVQDGKMTPKAFVDIYGTHVVVAGVYGATFDLHYEMIADTATVTKTFTNNTQDSISAQIGATLYGIQLEVGAESTIETKYEAFTSKSNSDQQTRFKVNAKGGNATGMAATSLGEFAPICEKWASGLKNSRDYVLVDVPDNSLIFVWDLLGDNYSGAKTKLHSYFNDSCDKSYEELNKKIKDLYKDSFTFNEETKTLTVNLSAFQTAKSASLAGVVYETFGEEVFNHETGIFKVFPEYDGVEVEKVVFKGTYGTKNRLGQRVKTKFDNFCIKFDEDWTNDIIIEFENFAYEAPTGYAGLDFSDVAAANITTIFTGDSYIKGGDGESSGKAGLMGINADGKNLIITGNGDLLVEGGNGANGANGENRSFSDHVKGFNGVNGGDGGKAIIGKEITINCLPLVELIGGTGGNGGNGGNITGESDEGDYADISDAGDGGNGGNGGNPINADAIIYVSKSIELLLKYGNGGNGGNGGTGGDARFKDNAYPDGKSHGGNGGNGGYGHNGGNGGSGGNGGKSYANAYWGKMLVGTTGDGGYGGKGGNTISSVLYNSGNIKLEYGIFGTGEKGGLAGGKVRDTDWHTDVTFGTDRSNTIGKSGSKVECSYNQHWIEQ